MKVRTENLMKTILHVVLACVASVPVGQKGFEIIFCKIIFSKVGARD